MYAVIHGSSSNSCKANVCNCWWYPVLVQSSPLKKPGENWKRRSWERGMSLTGCTLIVWHYNTKCSWTISMYTVSHYLFSFHRLLHSNAIKKIDVRAFAGIHGLESLWVLYYNWINFLVVGGGQNPIIYLILYNVYRFFPVCEEIR